ncbi:MAG: enoyl-CoA hydratase-related protein, partial [Alphaproteobacteria bacterium]
PYVVEAIGPRAARRYFLTAERFGAEEACRLGLLHEVVADKAALDAKVHELIGAVFQTAPGAVDAAKDLIRTVQHQEIDGGLISETAKRIAERRASDEGREGISAFLEKRKPNWVREHEELAGDK